MNVLSKGIPVVVCVFSLGELCPSARTVSVDWSCSAALLRTLAWQWASVLSITVSRASRESRWVVYSCPDTGNAFCRNRREYTTMVTSQHIDEVLLISVCDGCMMDSRVFTDISNVKIFKTKPHIFTKKHIITKNIAQTIHKKINKNNNFFDKMYRIVNVQ